MTFRPRSARPYPAVATGFVVPWIVWYIPPRVAFCQVCPIAPENAADPPMMVRPATVQDATAIVSLMRCASTELIRRTTVIGCHGLAAYVYDQIAAGSPNHYLVAATDDHLLGMSAWRLEGEYLFLNHLFVSPLAQRQGVGTLLLCHGTTRVPFLRARYLALDVYEDSPYARSWYHALGMTMEESKILMEAPLFPSPTVSTTNVWSSSFRHTWDPDYARYGFSRFSLSTEQATYTIGRLGTSLFRVVEPGLLDDAIALNALYTLDHDRTLLCIGTARELEAPSKRGGMIIGRTERLVAPLDAITAGIRERCAATNSPHHK